MHARKRSPRTDAERAQVQSTDSLLELMLASNASNAAGCAKHDPVTWISNYGLSSCCAGCAEARAWAGDLCIKTAQCLAGSLANMNAALLLHKCIWTSCNLGAFTGCWYNGIQASDSNGDNLGNLCTHLSAKGRRLLGTSASWKRKPEKEEMDEEDRAEVDQLFQKNQEKGVCPLLCGFLCS